VEINNTRFAPRNIGRKRLLAVKNKVLRRINVKKKNLEILLIAAIASMMLGCITSLRQPNPVIETDAGKDFATIDAQSVSFDTEAGSLTINNQASFDVIILPARWKTEMC
jgi:hypothetical protein